MTVQSFYPVQKQAKEKRKPYTRPTKSGPSRKAVVTPDETEEEEEEDELTDSRFNRQVEDMINQDVQDHPMSESPSREPSKRLVKHKVYKYNAWKSLMNEPARITNGELLQISPVVRQQLRTGIQNSKPEIKVREINAVTEGKQRKSSAY